MKTTDLMIGDYITLAESLNDERGPLIFQVVALNCPSEGEALMLLKGEKACDEMEIDDEWSGIPITPEILEKNGFKNVSNHTLKGCETYELRFGRYNDQKIIYKLGDYFAYESYDDRWYRLFETQICYKWCVHELQHALRLCGIEKEIVL